MTPGSAGSRRNSTQLFCRKRLPLLRTRMPSSTRPQTTAGNLLPGTSVARSVAGDNNIVRIMSPIRLFGGDPCPGRRAARGRRLGGSCSRCPCYVHDARQTYCSGREGRRRLRARPHPRSAVGAPECLHRELERLMALGYLNGNNHCPFQEVVRARSGAPVARCAGCRAGPHGPLSQCRQPRCDPGSQR